MHAHVSYLSETVPLCLMMLTVEKDVFFELSAAKQKIVEVSCAVTHMHVAAPLHVRNSSFQSLQKQNSFAAIDAGIRQGMYSPAAFGATQTRHFLYKAKTAAQYTSPLPLAPPYNRQKDRARLHGLYFSIQNRLHSAGRPLKLLFYGGPQENVVGWVSDDSHTVLLTLKLRINF